MSAAVDCEITVEGDGPPLILVHGVGAARDAWRFTAPTLAERFTVIRYDLRGHGASPKPSGPFDLDAMVADLERVRARAGVEAAHIAGHSLGGMIGPAYARAHPERVLSLSLLSTAAFRTPEDSAKVAAVVRAMTEKSVAQILPTLTDRWFTDRFIAERPDIVDRRLRQVAATDEAVFLAVFRLYADVEMGPWLREIAAPTLVLTGEHDGGCNPRLNRLIAEALPTSELVILPDLKHAILLEAGPEVARRIIDFVDRTTADVA